MKPLFILAPPRSFTSVVCAMIGVHPEMLGLPETNLFARETYSELRPLYLARPPFQHGLLRAFAELGLGEQSVENIGVVKAWLERQGDARTKDLFDDLAAMAAPRNLVEKSPLHVYSRGSLERMHRAYPEARYLHLTRHPRATCESIYALRQDTLERVQRIQPKALSAGLSEGPLLSALEMTPERMWLDPHLTILEFLDNVPAERWLRLRGEEVLSDPDRHLPEIAEWLGISSSPDAIAAMKHPETSPFARLGPANARFGNDPSFLEAPALRPYTPRPQDLTAPVSWNAGLTFSDVVVDLARMFGY